MHNGYNSYFVKHEPVGGHSRRLLHSPNETQTQSALPPHRVCLFYSPQLSRQARCHTQSTALACQYTVSTQTAGGGSSSRCQGQIQSACDETTPAHHILRGASCQNDLRMPPKHVTQLLQHTHLNSPPTACTLGPCFAPLYYPYPRPTCRTARPQQRLSKRPHPRHHLPRIPAHRRFPVLQVAIVFILVVRYRRRQRRGRGRGEVGLLRVAHGGISVRLHRGEGMGIALRRRGGEAG